MTSQEHLVRVAVLTTEDGDEALYVDGALRRQGTQLFACDIADAIYMIPCTFEHWEVQMPDEIESFPNELSEALAWRVML